MRQVSAVMPDDTQTYRGDRWVAHFMVLLTVVGTARSLIHVARRDGGAASIAGLDIEVDGGQNLVAIFAQWGLVQLLSAGMSWIVLFRYQGLIPLMLLSSLIENVGRVAIGQAKPLKVEKPPPGAYGSVVVTPLLTLALWCSLPPRGS